jgi:hypothetical protein
MFLKETEEKWKHLLLLLINQKINSMILHRVLM